MNANKFYVAYGSNLNIRQMGLRCPYARVVGKGKLKGYQLTFRAVATIEPQEGAETPVAVWRITPSDEAALDRYEGFPRMYRKETVEVEMEDGSKLKAMVYIMNNARPAEPNSYYFNVIKQGYHDIGLDTYYLDEALNDTQKRMSQRV